jgi:endonuclease/exonuclease/phosphatase family metal-dependent hydrolase
MFSRERTGLRVLFCGILLLFFFQLITDFFHAIYAFGLLGTSIPVEMASLLLMFSPLVLLAFPRGLPGWLLLLLGCGVLACRVFEPALDTRGRMLVSGVGVASFLAFLPALLHRRSREEEALDLVSSILSVILAVALSILFRALGSGVDISTDGLQALGWVLAVVAGVLLFILLRPGRAPEARSTPSRERGNAWRVAGLCLGLSGVVVVLCTTLTAPNVIARWTGANYVLVVCAAVLALGGVTFLLNVKRFRAALLRPGAILAWNAIYVLALVLTVLAHQVGFPSDPDSYPLSEPAVSGWHYVPLVVMLVSFPVLALDYGLYVRQLVDARPTTRALGAGFALFSLFFTVVALGQIFTTVYDYIPLVGPFFRDRFWLVYMVAGLGAAVPLMLVRRPAFGRVQEVQRTWLCPATVLGIGAMAIAVVVAAVPRPGVPAPKETLRVCTYNIQQGYDEGGLKNYGGQLELLRRVEADVIGLQESDTNRTAGGNADVVRYMADRLDMYSYYGPKTVVGTFGIALLSRYPIEQPRTFYMYSSAEQTATIEAQIRDGERTVHVYVTHLGNGGPIVQQEAILQEVVGVENVVLIGDFNFDPATEQYRLTREALDDAWLLRWPDGVDDSGRSFTRRIDHAFVSSGTVVLDAQYITDPESDHPALVVEIER